MSAGFKQRVIEHEKDDRSDRRSPVRNDHIRACTNPRWKYFSRSVSVQPWPRNEGLEQQQRTGRIRITQAKGYRRFRFPVDLGGAAQVGASTIRPLPFCEEAGRLN